MKPLHSQRILRISRVVADLDRAEVFYADALGFRRLSRGPLDRLCCSPSAWRASALNNR